MVSEAAIREDLVRSEIPERKLWFWCEQKSFFGRNQREGIGAQGKTHNSNFK